MPINDHTQIRVYQSNNTREICRKNKCSDYSIYRKDADTVSELEVQHRKYYITLKRQNCYKGSNNDVIKCITEDLNYNTGSSLKDSKVVKDDNGILRVVNSSTNNSTKIQNLLREERCKPVTVAGENYNSIKCTGTELLKCKINDTSKIVYCHTNEHWNTNNNTNGFSDIVKKRCKIVTNAAPAATPAAAPEAAVAPATLAATKNIECFDKSDDNTNNPDYYKFKNLNVRKKCTVDDDGKLVC